MGKSQKGSRIVIYDKELRALLEEGAKEQGIAISEYAKNIMRYAIENKKVEYVRYESSRNVEYDLEMMEGLRKLHQKMLREISMTSSNLNQVAKSLNTLVKTNGRALKKDKFKAFFVSVLNQVTTVKNAYEDAYGVIENDMKDYIKKYKK